MILNLPYYLWLWWYFPDLLPRTHGEDRRQCVQCRCCCQSHTMCLFATLKLWNICSYKIYATLHYVGKIFNKVKILNIIFHVMIWAWAYLDIFIFQKRLHSHNSTTNQFLLHSTMCFTFTQTIPLYQQSNT